MGDNRYYYKYPHPAVTTDCVVFGFDGAKLKILLIKRGGEPFKGCWALPGGFLNMDEDAEQGAKRELMEETNLSVKYMEQLHAFTNPNRDPRERVISIAHYAIVKIEEVVGGDDAVSAQWFSMDEIPRLAFDHDIILHKAVERLRERVRLQPMCFDLLPPKFTFKEIKMLYGAIFGDGLECRKFTNKLLRLDLLTMVEGEEMLMTKRQPKFYTFNKEKYFELKQKGLIL